MLEDGDRFTLPGVYRAIRVGDTFTIANLRNVRRNPWRRWWQFWKPRYVPNDDLARFVVTATATGHVDA